MEPGSSQQSMAGSWGTNSASTNCNKIGSNYFPHKESQVVEQSQEIVLSLALKAFLDKALSSLVWCQRWPHFGQEVGLEALVPSNLECPMILKKQNLANPVPKGPMTSPCALSVLLFCVHLFAVLTSQCFYIQENLKPFMSFVPSNAFIFVFKGCSYTWK